MSLLGAKAGSLGGGVSEGTVTALLALQDEFTELKDVFDDFTGTANRLVQVNAAADEVISSDLMGQEPSTFWVQLYLRVKSPSRLFILACSKARSYRFRMPTGGLGPSSSR